jgi:hypothetical protein
LVMEHGPRQKTLEELLRLAGGDDGFVEEEKVELTGLIEDCNPADKEKLGLLDEELQQIENQSVH